MNNYKDSARICCSYLLCRRNGSNNDQFKPVPLSEMEDGSSNGRGGGNHNKVQLDTSSMGQQAVVVKNGKRICGNGAALTNCPISQNKAYFEIKIQSSGTWGVGLATPKVNLDTVPLGNNNDSWVLRDNGQLWHNGNQVGLLSNTDDSNNHTSNHIDKGESHRHSNGKIGNNSSNKRLLQEGDIIGISYDHETLCFRINGESSPSGQMRGMKGCLYPVIYVDDGAILDVEFIHFRYSIPSGFSEIQFEKQLL